MFQIFADALVGRIPKGKFSAYVTTATAAGDRNQFRQIAKIVRSHPDVSHRILCVAKQPGVYFVAPEFWVSEGGLPVAVERLRAEGINVNDGGLVRDPGKFLDVDDLLALLDEPNGEAQQS